MPLNNHQRQAATKVVALEQTLSPVDWEALELQDGALRTHIASQEAAVEVEGTVSVDNFPAVQTVDGTVDVGNFPAVQTVDGTVSVDNFPTVLGGSSVPTSEVLPTSVSSQIVTVATSGTPVQGGDVPCKIVTVQSPSKAQPNSGGAWAPNTGYLFIGTQNAPGPVIELAPGDKATFSVSNTNLLWFDAETNSQVALLFVST